MKKLPDELFVIRQNAGTDDEFLAAHEKPDALAELGKKIKAGRYVLQETVTITAETKVS